MGAAPSWPGRPELLDAIAAEGLGVDASVITLSAFVTDGEEVVYTGIDARCGAAVVVKVRCRCGAACVIGAKAPRGNPDT
jgi:hypothetical protein